VTVIAGKTLPEEDVLASTEFVARLRAQAAGYHDLHPFHVRMNRGTLSRAELQCWVANRFYYQRSIPLKDAAIVSNCPELEIRRMWVKRIVDHDGARTGSGGIESWLKLGEALGVERDEIFGERRVLPGVRFAVDAYVNFCRTRPWIEAVAASLTELFAPGAIQSRIEAFERHYPWIDPAGLNYFRQRLEHAPKDAQYALELVVGHCGSRQEQERAVAALAFKCDVLWAQLDAIDQAGTRPGLGRV
jgi:pyrroloquinoline-quinone synthase